MLYIDTDTCFTAYLMAGFILNDDKSDGNSRYDLRITTTGGRIIGKNNNNYGVSQNISETNHYNEAINNRLIDIFLPSEGRFESLLGQIIASMPDASIVIFDSLNSFFNMYPVSYTESQKPRQLLNKKRQDKYEEKQNVDTVTTGKTTTLGTPEPGVQTLYDEPKKSRYTISRLNHLLSIFIMLLVKHGVYHNIPVIVTSMVRYKKVSEGLWIKSPVCRRLLNQKSVVRLSVEMNGEKDLSVNIMKHPLLGQQTIVFDDAGIYRAFEID